MVFTSWAFVRFFAVVLVGLWILPTRTLRQLLVLLASAYFYAYWMPAYLLLLATPSVIDYVCAGRIANTTNVTAKKGWLWFSIVTNLGLLAYFKYANFLLENVSALVGVPARHLDIVLPVGISFYTFKTLSYTIDVYRGVISASRSPWRYAMFVTYFPELVAGPIVRASVFLPQMGRQLKPSVARLILGGQIILLGVTKKVVVADRLAEFVDVVFAAPEAYSTFTIASAAVAYSLQIYCDFSGYSDIAIGVSRIIGYDLPENFNMPYLATSITDFWRRWHMTLSLWLRDYLYVPLGGNRKGVARTYLNLMITMLLGGLWHGASWTFVFWGLLHGAALVVHKFWQDSRHPLRPASQVTAFLGWLTTYVFVCVAWIFFRAERFGDAVIMLRKLALFDRSGVEVFYLPLFLFLPLVVGAHYLGAIAAQQATRVGGSAKRIPAPSWLAPLYGGAPAVFALRPHPAAGLYVILPMRGAAFVLTVWIAGVYLLSAVDVSPFIYFQF